MSDAATVFLPTLGRTTLWLILAGLTTATILHLAHATWPAAHRIGWVVTLVVGWTFLRLPIVVPWYDAPTSVGGANAATIFVPQAPFGPPENPSPLAGEGGDGHRREALVGEPGEGSQVIADDESHFAVSQGNAFHRLTNFSEISTSPAARIDWPLAAVGAWALGVIGLVAVWLIGYLRFVRALPSSLPADEAWLDQWGKLLLASGVRRSIPLRVTADMGPMLCRLPHGYELLVPADLWRELEIGQRGAILRHELAHYLRGDVWKSLAARVLALPHWFNPASWWAVRRFEEAAEWACDRAATAEVPSTTYAKALVLLGASASGPAAYGSAARGPALAVRIRRLLNLQAKEDSMMKKTLLVASVLGLAALSLVRLQLVAKEPGLADEPAVKAEELDRPEGDQKPAAAPAAEAVQLQKKLAAEQQAQALTNHSRIANDLSRIRLEVLLAEGRSTKTEGDRLSDAKVEEYVNQDPNILQATKRVGLMIEQLAIETQTNRADVPRLIILRDKIQKLEQGIQDRKAGMRAELKKQATAERAALSMLEKGKERLELAHEEAEKSVDEKTAKLRGIERFLALTASKRARSEIEAAEAAGEKARAALGEEPVIEKVEPNNSEPAAPPASAEGAKPAVGSTEGIQLQREQVAGENLELERKTAELEKARDALDFTEKLLLKGYTTKAQRDVQAFAVKRAESDLRLAQAAKAAETSAASRKMVEQGQRAFEATLAAYEAETTTLGVVCEWSLKWMAAAENAARDQKQKVEAVSAHLERVRKLQAKIKSLYESGTKGGEATEMAAANFYVAEAERRLAEVMQNNAATSTDDPFRLPVYRNGRVVTEKNAVIGADDVELQILDLNFKIAELEGQLNESKVQLEATLNRLSKMERLGNVVSEQDIRQLQEETAKLEIHQETLNKQLDLSRRKLRVYERANSAPDSITKPATPSLTSKAEAPAASDATETTARASLLYNGKNFNAWAQELRDDLSPVRRREAIGALATFGANGYGPQAAAEILKAMRGYSASNMDNSPEAILAATALAAFEKIPRKEAFPLVVKALKSDNANERLFAVTVLRRVSSGPADDLPQLLELLKDPDTRVRMRTMIEVAGIDTQRPELLPVLREALASDDPNAVREAIRIAGGNWGVGAKNSPAIPVLAPELVGLLNHVDKFTSEMVASSLLHIGAAAIPELEKAILSEDSKDKATKTEEVLREIRKQGAKEEG